MGKTRENIPVGSVWLMNDGSDIVVYIERDGVYYEAIREGFYGPSEGTISHCITASGIESMHKRANWLMDAPKPKEA